MMYLVGRAFQFMALMAMPSAIWVGQFAHDEKGAISIFLGAILIFYTGYLLTRISHRLS